jgi:5-methylcytosine-specific restriction endonuclease McrA
MEKESYDNPLGANVLVLNKFYGALRVVTARRAFVFLAKDSAEVVDKSHGRFQNYRFERWIDESRHNGRALADYAHTPSLRIMVPRVIRLLECDQTPRRRLKFHRKNIMARDNHQCQYCGATAEPRPNRGGRKYHLAAMTIDHVVPRSRGGRTDWDNVVACCGRCNARKGGRLPQEAGMKLKSKPQSPRFEQNVLRMIRGNRYLLWREFIGDLPGPECDFI